MPLLQKYTLCFWAVLVFLSNTLAAHAGETPVELKTATGTIKGTLLMPESKKPVPVVLLISGSGPTDRDGNNPMMQNNSLKMLAEELLKQNIASLRYDKRGIGQSKEAGKAEADLRFEHYVDDATGWINQLKQDKRFAKVVVLGHSEGSLIGMIATQKAKGNAFVSVAGAGEPADAIIKRQLATQPQAVKDEILPAIEKLAQGQTVENTNPMYGALLRPGIQPYLISWFKYNPQTEIKKLTVPVLVLQGTTDLQTSNNDAKLLAEATPKHNLIMIEKMNHVLKEAPLDQGQNIATYSNPALPLVPAFTLAVTEFILALK